MEWRSGKAGRVGDLRYGSRVVTGRAAELRNRGGAERGQGSDSMSGNSDAHAVIRNKHCSKEVGSDSNDAPVIRFEDQVEFPILKATSRVV